MNREWNRGRPENYVYTDLTASKWFRGVNLPWLGRSGDVDSYLYCKLPTCQQPLALDEDTRDPVHRHDGMPNLIRLATKAGLPGIVTEWSGSQPKTLYIATPGSDKDLFRRYIEGYDEQTPLGVPLASGPREIRAQKGLIGLRHMLRFHDGHRAMYDLARALAVEIAEPPE